MKSNSRAPLSAAPPFLALDFETAHYDSDSACSIGLVRVEGNQIVSEDSFLIQPPNRNFVFTSIHGITWEQVKAAPLFLDLWPRLKPLFEGIEFIAAHNARFDQKVLYACCERYKITPPPIRFECTVQWARQYLKIYPTNLPAVCSELKIPLKHHDASSDARACAKIALSVLASQANPCARTNPLPFPTPPPVSSARLR